MGDGQRRKEEEEAILAQYRQHVKATQSITDDHHDEVSYEDAPSLTLSSPDERMNFVWDEAGNEYAGIGADYSEWERPNALIRDCGDMLLEPLTKVRHCRLIMA